MRRPVSLVLIGDPAAGKTTQAGLLGKKLGSKVIDTGSELRRIARTGKRLGGMEHGDLVPTVLVRQILADKISKTPLRRGLILSGSPRSAQEARIVHRLLGYRGHPIYVVYLALPVEEGRRRAAVRGRKDDTAAVLARRRRVQKPHLDAVVRFFKNKYPYARISGEGTRAEVRRRIEAFIRNEASKRY